VVTHGDIAIGRKHDIGPLWPHRRAALEFNVGIWPLELQIDLNRFADFVYDDYFYFITCIGYVPPDDTERGRASTVVAYKEHFATHNISSELDKTTRVTILRHVITLRHYVDHGRHYRFFNAKLDIWLDTHEYGVRAFSDFF
jgi:N-acetyl-anhydromuramyl-L-alanine amidase AmpD